MAIEKVVNIVIKDNISVTDKHVKDLDKSLNSLQGASNGVTGSMKESSLSVLDNGGAMGLLNDATGGLAMTVKDAVEATALFAKQSKISTAIQAAYATVVGASTGAMKIFRLALVGTGIGAIVVGLGLLIANFDKVKKAVMNLVPGLAVIGAIFNSLVEAVTDFIGVTSDASRELDRLGEQADKTLSKNKFALEAYGDTYDEFTKRKIEANSKYAQHVKDINEDETLSEQQKLAKLKILRETANREIDKSEADRQAAKEKKAKEDADKIKTDNEKSAADKKKKEEEAKALLLEKIKTEAETRHDALQDELEEEKERQIQRDKDWEEKNDKENQRSANAYARMVADADEKKAFEDEQRDYKKKVEQQLHDSLFSMADSTATLIENMEQLGMKKSKAATTLRKGMALAQIAIDTGKAISSAIPMAIDAGKGAASVGGPAAGILGAIAMASSYAGSLAMITSNVVRAKSILSGGGAAGGGSAGGNDGGRQSAPPQFNIVGQNSNNQLAQSIGKSQNRPVEAFVVSGNMTTAQSLDRNRIATATFNS
jgi:chemotaxis protein histidine kinase CheA